MYRLIKYAMVVGCTVLLIGCASTKTPSVSDATNGYSSEDGVVNGVQTRGLGSESNLLGEDGGPSEGVLGMRSFYFPFDSIRLAPKDLEAIRAHAEYLLAHPEAHVVIEGNCDSRGSREYNIGLGQRRADAIMSVFASAGVSGSQLRTLSYGSERPIALGHAEEAYRLNRRGDVVYE